MDTLADAKRIDIISDTHGYLSDELLAALEGADLIIHAGDMTSEADWDHLNTIAPIKAVLGNNDYYRDYGPGVLALNTFTHEGLSFAVAHYREELPVSPTYPRSARGNTMARLFVADGRVISADIIDL